MWLPSRLKMKIYFLVSFSAAFSALICISFVLYSLTNACMMMNKQRRIPTTILVHQADNVPWKEMIVKIVP